MEITFRRLMASFSILAIAPGAEAAMVTLSKSSAPGPAPLLAFAAGTMLGYGVGKLAGHPVAGVSIGVVLGLLQVGWLGLLSLTHSPALNNGPATPSENIARRIQMASLGRRDF